MVLFNWDWSHLINRLSLIRSLNLFASEARIAKWSKSVEQLHSSRWSDSADCLTLLRRFPVKLDIPICFSSSKKVDVWEVAMGSPLGPTLSNVFLCYHEKIWLQNCPSEFKLVIYRRYVDDTFLLFRSKRHIEKFRNYWNRQHRKYQIYFWDSKWKLYTVSWC